ncbi:MAG: hypothetical protein HC898_04705 [Phycisphaerales bacterium]|nr:hypothetical protein [Phycisphaerales bacterium]
MPAPNRQRILRQHLQTDQLLGVSAVPVHLQAIAPISATPKSTPPPNLPT